MKKVGMIVLAALAVVVCAGLLLLNWFLGGSGGRQSDIDFSVSPDGKWIVFNGGDFNTRNLYLMNLSSRKVTRVTNAREYEHSPTFSPDGKRIVFSAGEAPLSEHHLYSVSIDGTHRVRLTSTSGVSDSDPVFSRDGSEIAFCRAALRRPYSMGGYSWNDWDLWVMHSDGSHPRRITNGKYYQLYSPCFSPNAKNLLFTAYASGSDDTYLVDADGTRKPRILVQKAYYPDVGVHHDLVAFISDREIPFKFEVWTMNPDGSNTRQVTHYHSGLRSPRLSPDGQGVYVLLRRGDLRYDLMYAPLKDGKPRLIADSSLFDNPLSWKP